MRTHIGKFLAVSILAWGVTPACAGEISVAIGEQPGTVKVLVQDAPVDDVLREVGKVTGFKVERPGSGSSSTMLSGRYEGELGVVLSRLLRGEGHMIVRSEEARSGIEKVVMITSGTSGGASNRALLAQRRRAGQHRPTRSDANAEREQLEEEARAEEEAARLAEEQQQRQAKLRRMRQMQQQQRRR